MVNEFWVHEKPSENITQPLKEKVDRLRNEVKNSKYPLTVAFLRKNEWNMGNGQCNYCYGSCPDGSWIGQTGDLGGHKKDCPLAAVLEEIGEEVIWEQGKYPNYPKWSILKKKVAEV